jgi:hypothetical protein
MGYLIEPGLIKKETFLIRSSFVQTMDATTPYVLKNISGNYFIPIAANLSLDTVGYVVGYSGWTHLHLSLNDTTFANPAIFASLASNACIGGIIERQYNFQFNMNFQPSPPSPNRFGSNIFEDNDLYIWWDNLPIAGDSNMIVNIYYINEIFT